MGRVMNSAEPSGLHPAMPCPARAGGAGHGVRRRHVLGALAGGGAGLAGAAQAAPAAGLSVVQVASFSGPVAFYAQQLHAGLAVALQRWNEGQPAARRVQLVQRDDGMDPARTAALYRELAASHAPLAFVYPTTPETAEVVLKERLPQQLGIPLLGTMPSMPRWREPLNPFVFHLGLGEDREIAKILAHCVALGQRSLGVSYWNTPADQASGALVRRLAAEHGLQVVADVAVAPDGKADIPAALERLLAPSPSALLCLLPTNEAAELLKGLRRRGSRLFMYGPSFIEPRLLHEWAGAAAATGVGLSQYLPNPFNTRLPLVAQYQEALRKHGSAQDRIGSLTFEGYVAGRVLCEALGRLRGEPSAARLRDALEGLDALELGGLPLSYGPRKHVGLQYLEIGVLSGGRLNY